MLRVVLVLWCSAEAGVKSMTAASNCKLAKVFLDSGCTVEKLLS